ncbi:HNH homing endonuclease [Pseudomonas phage Ka1]|nr:HNH homing endonuclease [Pseudomonas phage Ka1]
MQLSQCVPWLWATDRCGYGVLTFKRKLRKAHRVAYCMANSLQIEDIDGVIIRHKCDNPWCVNVDHLEPGTHQDNEDDKTKRGRRPMGEKVGSAKLNRAQVESIRKEYVKSSKTFGSVALGNKYGVHSSTIRYIIAGDIW